MCHSAVGTQNMQFVVSTHASKQTGIKPGCSVIQLTTVVTYSQFQVRISLQHTHSLAEGIIIQCAHEHII